MVAAVGVAAAGAAISAGTSAASSSAQSSANKKAQQIQQQQFAETKAALEKGNTEAQGYIKPYADVGGSALNELAYGMGLATPEAGYTSANIQKGGLANYGMDQYQKDVGYTPMVTDLASLQATPGYQFQLEQGLQGVNNSAAARGGLLSGANMKAINDYAQGQASTGYASAWERAQNAYTNAFGRNQQKFTNLQSMANNGQNAAEFQGKAALNTGNQLAGASTNYGNNMGNLALGQGQNQANMINGIGNAVGGLVSRSGGLMSGFGGGGSSSGGGGGSSAGLSGLASGNAPSSMVSWGYNPQLNQIKGLG
jgi:hypothetical protein